MTAEPTRLLSVTAVAEQLDCSRGHVYNLAAAGHFRLVEIKATGTRPKTRIYAAEVEAFIERQTRAPRPAPSAEAVEPERLPLDELARRDRYTTTEAADYTRRHTEELRRAMVAGDLHGTRTGPRRQWAVEHDCLVAWLAGALCAHQRAGQAPRGGDVR